MAQSENQTWWQRRCEVLEAVNIAKEKQYEDLQKEIQKEKEKVDHRLDLSGTVIKALKSKIAELKEDLTVTNSIGHEYIERNVILQNEIACLWRELQKKDKAHQFLQKENKDLKKKLQEAPALINTPTDAQWLEGKKDDSPLPLKTFTDMFKLCIPHSRSMKFSRFTGSSSGFKSESCGMVACLTVRGPCSGVDESQSYVTRSGRSGLVGGSGGRKLMGCSRYRVPIEWRTMTQEQRGLESVAGI